MHACMCGVVWSMRPGPVVLVVYEASYSGVNGWGSDSTRPSVYMYIPTLIRPPIVIL